MFIFAKFVLLAFIFYLALNFIRAFRFALFFKEKTELKKFLPIVLIHNFWNQILPFSSGELTYIYLTKKSGRINLGESLTSLLAARIFDFFTIIFFTILSFYVLSKKTGAVLNFEINNLILALASVLFFLFIFLVIFNKKITAPLQSVFQKIGFLKFKAVKFLFVKFSEAMDALCEARSFKVFFKLGFYSLLVWIFDLFITMFLSLSGGVGLNFWQAAAASGILMFTIFILPFQTPLNLGTYEGALFLAYSLFGFETALAIKVAALVHIENIVFALILFLPAFVFRKKEK